MSQIRVLSASQVDTYRSCSLKWWFRYVDKAPDESKSGALIVGSTVDVAVKGAIHALRSGEATLAALKPTDLAREAWEAEIRSNGDRPVLWGEKGQEGAYKVAAALVEAFLKLPDLAARIERVVALDVRFELPVNDPDTGVPIPSLSIQGILDAVERGNDGLLRPLDLKTAATRAGYSPDDLVFHLQGSLYVWALREIHPEKAGEEMAFSIGLKLKEPCWEDRTVTLGPEARRRALLTVLHARRGMDLEVAFPQPSFLCGSCPHLRRCKRWQDDVLPLASDPFIRVGHPSPPRVI